MLIIKRIDYFGQLVLAALMLLSIPILYFYGFLAGLFLLGCWQLLSAFFNTFSFLSLSQRKQIWWYWKLCIADLTILLTAWISEKKIDPDIIHFMSGTAILGAVFIAVYYLIIYYKLIELIFLRNELDGLTKTKH